MFGTCTPPPPFNKPQKDILLSYQEKTFYKNLYNPWEQEEFNLGLYDILKDYKYLNHLVWKKWSLKVKLYL